MECANFITDHIAISLTNNYWHVVEYYMLV